MANRNLAQLTELTTPSDNDFLYILDVSDTSENPLGTGKKIRKDKVDSGASKENIANKQNSLAIDGTGTKYPTVDAVNAVLPTTYSKVVYVNATSPTTATIFDTENPPITNNNALKNDTANLYIGTDASTWVYLTGTGYVTKTISSATSNFYNAGTSVDAGNSKTSHITRSGNISTTGKLSSSGATTLATTATETAYIGTTTSNPDLAKFVVKGTKSGTGSHYIASFLDDSGVSKAKIDDFGNFIISNEMTTSGVQLGVGKVNVSDNGGLRGSSSKYFLSRSSNWESTVKIDYFADYSSTYTSRSLVDKGYTDGKITQTITNGVTDKSPSEDAVFDALDLKVAGSGTTNYLPKFTASRTVGNSQIFDNGTNVGIGTTSPTAKLSIKSTSYPVLDITRDSGISGDAIFGVARFERLTTTPTTDGGLGFFFNYPNSASQSTFCGLFGGYLSDITAGAEVGNVVFAASWRNVSPANNKHLIIRATGTSTGNVLVPNGKLLVATSIDDGITTNVVQVAGNVKATQFRISALNTAPTSATDTGTLGEVRITSTYIYVCTATNTWVRTALATW